MARKDESYILKKMKEELGTEPWRTQYPSTTVSWELKGDPSYCEQLRGEAKVMLYNLKNRIKLLALAGPPYGLKSLQDIQQYDDGTVIIVKSIYGQDFIEINAGKGFPSCSITLFDIPLTVQPMYWYSDGIQPGEVEGVDYIKTYYSYSSINCSICKPDFSICDTNELSTTYGWTAPQTCTPFVFEDATIPIKEGYPDNHCINGTCQAEIISFGSDAGGAYFLWKAYTEWSQLGPPFGEFTKTGLGYLLLRGFTIFNGQQLCTSSSSIVKVDCCEKVIAERIPIIYWEKCIGGGWCIAPSSGSIEVDLDYFWQLGAWISMTLWAKENWCRNMTWVVSTGIGEITSSDDGTYGYYKVSYTELGDILDALGCNDSYEISIKGTDRCGTDDSITFTHTPCCDTAAALEIGYTTLAMSCSGSQTLTAVGGCAPYEWGLSGGGTLTPAGDTLTALYEAAATNAECANNATITLSDCCGGSDSIQIAVNCYTADVAAYTLLTATWGGSVCANANCGCNGTISGCHAGYRHQHYRCNGTLKTDWVNGDPCAGSTTTCLQGGNLQISPCTPIGTLCETIYGDPCNYITVEGKKCWAADCTDPNCQYLHPCGYSCSTISALMKTQGCCPINPYTGLPF